MLGEMYMTIVELQHLDLKEENDTAGCDVPSRGPTSSGVNGKSRRNALLFAWRFAIASFGCSRISMLPCSRGFGCVLGRARLDGTFERSTFIALQHLGTVG